MSSAKESSRSNPAQKVLDSAWIQTSVELLANTIRIALFDISQLLNTELDRQTLGVCVNMIESGVNPEALAVSLDFIKMSRVKYID